MNSADIKFARIEIDREQRRTLSAHPEFGAINRGILRAIGAANGQITSLEKLAKKATDEGIPANMLWDRALDAYNAGAPLLSSLIKPGEPLNMSAEERMNRGKPKKKTVEKKED